jgi:hypothetical protein
VASREHKQKPRPKERTEHHQLMLPSTVGPDVELVPEYKQGGHQAAMREMQRRLEGVLNAEPHRYLQDVHEGLNLPRRHDAHARAEMRSPGRTLSPGSSSSFRSLDLGHLESARALVSATEKRRFLRKHLLDQEHRLESPPRSPYRSPPRSPFRPSSDTFSSPPRSPELPLPLLPSISAPAPVVTNGRATASSLEATLNLPRHSVATVDSARTKWWRRRDPPAATDRPSWETQAQVERAARAAALRRHGADKSGMPTHWDFRSHYLVPETAEVPAGMLESLPQRATSCPPWMGAVEWSGGGGDTGAVEWSARVRSPGCTTGVREYRRGGAGGGGGTRDFGLWQGQPDLRRRGVSRERRFPRLPKLPELSSPRRIITSGNADAALLEALEAELGCSLADLHAIDRVTTADLQPDRQWRESGALGAGAVAKASEEHMRAQKKLVTLEEDAGDAFEPIPVPPSADQERLRAGTPGVQFALGKQEITGKRSSQLVGGEGRHSVINITAAVPTVKPPPSRQEGKRRGRHTHDVDSWTRQPAGLQEGLPASQSGDILLQHELAVLAVLLGLGRIVALCYHSSISY